MANIEIGAARTDITVIEPGLGMMGWGMLDNVVRDAATPLHARAFVLRDSDGGDTLALVCCELAFISLAVREGVCRRLRDDHPELGLDLDNVMLMATHTHSGPGGFTHYPFYNITIPGFSQEVCDQIIDGIVEAIVDAYQARAPGSLRYGEGAFDPSVQVAFNRSIEAYNRNPDVDPVTWDERHLAVDRCMRLLRFDTADGRPLGAINWFGVHCTSVHSDNTSIHFDNKGYAAQMLEASLVGRGATGFVGAFAQGSAGDVTPNFRRHREKPWVRGKFVDDDESARHNGGLQHAQALRVFDEAKPVEPRLLHAHAYVDFSRVDVDPEFADGRRRRTAPAEIGMSMFFGTEEGPGLPRRLLFLQRVASALRPVWRRLRPVAPERDETQAEKIPWVESARRRVLGVERLRRIPIPWHWHPALRLVRELDRSSDPDPKPWTPNVLPVQLFVIGDLAIAAVPAEFTTTSATRVRQMLLRELEPLGVRHSVVAGYSNAYAGYVTTAEEYALQDYEGASTHFGKWTQAAYMTELRRLARRLREPTDAMVAANVRPPEFTADELARRSYAGGRSS